jgi:hydrogenase maturation protease
LGGSLRRVLIVGCEPLETEDGIGLSEPVDRAVGEAVRLVHSIVTDLTGDRASPEAVGKRSSGIAG